MIIFNREIKKWYIDFLAYFGLLISGIFFLCYVSTGRMTTLLEPIIRNTGATASYLMLASVFIIFSYCTCEESLRSYLFLSSAVMNFFVLLLNKNIVSIWLMTGVLLGIPLLLRPTAELIKRVMQLFFVFVFLLCNMSLITNYTNILTVTISYDLEISVYLEMLLAFGGLVFFHYWDRLPEGADLSKISMLKLQRKIRAVFSVYVVVFIGIILGGNCWQKLPDEGYRKIVKEIAILLVNEINTTDSLFFAALNKGGIAVIGLVIFLICKLVKRLQRKYHPDKEVTNMLIILTILFMAECLVWNLTWGNILLHFVFLFLAYFMYEEKKKVVIVQRRMDYEKESMEQDFGSGNDADMFSSVDENAGVCG